MHHNVLGKEALLTLVLFTINSRYGTLLVSSQQRPNIIHIGLAVASVQVLIVKRIISNTEFFSQILKCILKIGTKWI